MRTTFIQQFQPPPQLAQPALWLIFHGEKILLDNTTSQPRIPQFNTLCLTGPHIVQQQYLGLYGQTHCFAAEVATADNFPNHLAFEHLRQSFALLKNEDLFLLTSRAKQILFWDKSTQFCSYCGTKTINSPKERAKICPNCNNLCYPHVNPVILALVSRDEEILLARSPHFNPQLYSILAGFVEPGETVEQTVAREVFEEVGIEIKNIRYFGSQPWPFPSNLMLGFTADYASGEIHMDPIEIEDAQWFSRHSLPVLPNKISLARQMIEQFLKKSKKGRNSG